MVNARPIDIIDIPSTDEDWINMTFPNRGKTNLSSKAIGIEILDDAVSTPAIIIDDFKWVTIKGKPINIGGRGGGVSGRVIPAYKMVGAKRKAKLDAIQDLMGAERSGQGVKAARIKAKGAGVSDAEIKSVIDSKGKNAIVDGKHGKHGIFESPPKKVPGTRTKVAPKAKVEPKKKPIRKEKKIGDPPLNEYGRISGDDVRMSSSDHGKTFNNYLVGNTNVNVDSRISKERGIDSVYNALAAVPRNDRAKIKQVDVYKGDVIDIRSSSKSVGGYANYNKSRIAVFADHSSHGKTKGIMVHEIGHFQQVGSNRVNPGRFNNALKMDNKDVTAYGTKNKKGEAFAESYAKFMLTGKVTSAGGRSIMKNVTGFFNQEYGIRKGAGSASELLNNTEEILTIETFARKANTFDLRKYKKITYQDDDATITSYLNKDGGIVFETFDLGIKSKNQEVIIDDSNIIIEDDI